jgi:Ca2+-binding RTX toxin-like protein
MYDFLGNDILLGEASIDYLYGESGSNTILGRDDSTNDILDGGSGENIVNIENNNTCNISK